MIELKTNTESKLSTIRKGFWRNRWIDILSKPNWHFGYGFWPSSEIAEQKALEYIATGKRTKEYYIGPVFVPEEDK